jgi:hypothetical protein
MKNFKKYSFLFLINFLITHSLLSQIEPRDLKELNYSQLGSMHNDYVSFLLRTDQIKLSDEEKFKNLLIYAKVDSNTVSWSDVQALYKKYFVQLNESQTSVLNQMVTDGRFSQKQGQLLAEAEALLSKNSDKNAAEINLILQDYESQINKRSDLLDVDKAPVLSYCAVAKSSAQYWEALVSSCKDCKTCKQKWWVKLAAYGADAIVAAMVIAIFAGCVNSTPGPQCWAGLVKGLVLAAAISVAVMYGICNCCIKP